MKWEKIQPAGLHWGRRLHIRETYFDFWGKYWFKHFKGSFSLSPLLVVYSPLMNMKCESQYCNYRYDGIWQWFKYTYLTNQLHPFDGKLEVTVSNRIYRWLIFAELFEKSSKEEDRKISQKYWDKISTWPSIHCYTDMLDETREKVDWFKIYTNLDNNVDMKFYKRYAKELKPHVVTLLWKNYFC